MRNFVYFKFDASQVSKVSRTGLDAVINYGLTDQVTVKNYYALQNTSNHYDTDPAAEQIGISFSFDDGTVWDNAQIMAMAPPPAPTEIPPNPLDDTAYFINALVARDDKKTDGKTLISYRFASAARDERGFSYFTLEQTEAIAQALSKFSAVLNIQFVESTSVSSDLTFFLDDLTSGDSGAAAGYASAGTGEVHLNSRMFKTSNSLNAGQVGFEVLLHELGHALGLKHPFEAPVLPVAENTQANTVMSYTSNNLNDSELKLFDIAALQYLYGVNAAIGVGDNQYGFANRYIADAAGVDVFSAAEQTANVTINLNVGGWSFVGVKQASILADGQSFIGYGTVIEEAIAGSGNDTLIGNHQDNRLSGGLGQDTLIGGLGNDELMGGEGIDHYVFNVGDGLDSMTDTSNDNVIEIDNVLVSSVYYSSGALHYGLNHDSIRVDASAVSSVVVNGQAYTFQYFQSIYSGFQVSESSFTLDNSNNRGLLLGSADIDITGNNQDNLLKGNTGNNRLDGGLGADTLMGGLGDDSYFIDNYRDTVVEEFNQGNDGVIASISFSLTSDIENLTLMSGAINAVDATGNTLNNLVIGNQLSNHIDGGAGDDTLIGGAGNDTYYVDSENDQIVELVQEGVDTVISTALNYVLSANVEMVILRTQSQALSAVGSEGNNNLKGNENNNNLQGLGGNDSLEGGLGDDTLSGGQGNDYLSDASGNNLLQGNEGDDILMGSNGADWVEGNEDNDQLRGGEGNDTLSGGAGNDVLDGGNGSDTYLFGRGDGQDVIGQWSYASASVGMDTLLLGVNANELSFARRGYTADLYIYIKDSTDGLRLINYFTADGSTDATLNDIRTADGQVYHYQDIRQLILNGTPFDDVIFGFTTPNTIRGQAGNDRLEGNIANDSIDGGTGNDTLIGGAGFDTLRGGAGNDIYAVDRYSDLTADTLLEEVNDGQDIIKIEHIGTSTGIVELDLRPLANIEGIDIGLDARYYPSQVTSLSIIGNAANNIFYRTNYCSNVSYTGGLGDDTYEVVRILTPYNENVLRTQHQTLELANQGIDTVIVYDDSGVWGTFKYDSYVLADNIENMTLRYEGTYTMPMMSLGNTLDNRIIGSDIADNIYGMDGNDTISGGNNVDEVYGGVGNDLLYGDEGNDLLYGGAGINTLNGDAGNDTLYAQGSSDFLTGGTGDDTLTIGSGSVQCYFTAGSDYDKDTIQLSGQGQFTLNMATSLQNLALNIAVDQYGNGQYQVSYAANKIVALASNAEKQLGYIVTQDATLTFAGFLDWLRANPSHYHSSAQIIDPLLSTIAGSYYDVNRQGNQMLLAARGTNGEHYNFRVRGLLTPLDNYSIDNNGDLTLSNLSAGINHLEFSNHSHLYIGSSQADNFVGTQGGNDWYIGSTGGDTYAFGVGSGQDTLQLSATASTDRINLLVLPSQVRLSQVQSDLLFSLDTGDTLTIKRYFDSPTSAPDIQFTDGTHWSIDNVYFAVYGATRGNDLLTGTSGNDNLFGWLGNDTLMGGAGIDSLSGGEGADQLVGGLDSDRYTIDNVDDIVIEKAYEGSDWVLTSVSYQLSANVEILQLVGAASINATGNSENNSLMGNTGDNRLDGGLGADYMVGSTGNDTYVVDNTADVVLEYEANVGGIDTVEASISYVLGDHTENLILTGTTAINGTGNTLNNRLVGNSAVNILKGGLGNDTYVVGVGDTVTENINEGVDTVESALTWTLGTNVENLTLTGTAAINGVGNTLANVLLGNSATNTLNGSTGADTLMGGLGNDSYVVDNVGDVTTENVNEGVDTVQSSIAWSLSANLENLTLTGNAAIAGTGNDLDNILTGNSSKNALKGGAGNDVYVVDLGDTVIENANEGVDTVQTAITWVLAANIENLTLTGSGTVNATGNSLDNVLVGNSGKNKLLGGLGNDTYIVGTGDTVTENANQGVDVIQSNVTWTLGANVENLTLTGTTAISGTGNTLANVFKGNSANNTLTGLAGNDTYQFDAGWAVDSVLDNDSTANNVDIARFGSGIGHDQLWFKTNGTSLEVTRIGTADKLIISNWYTSTAYHLEQFKTADNFTLDHTKVAQLVQAMSAMTAPPSGQTTLTTQQHQQLDAVIAGSWV